MTSLDISNLGVTFGTKRVIDNLSLSLKEGEIASLLGPSGCGKTTLLRAIAGLIQPTEGVIRLGNQLVGVSSVVLPPHKRNTGYVPQHGALFPHLNVAKNIAFGMDRKLYSKSEIANVTAEMLSLIGMSGFEEVMPSQLSGGQQTRVSLARALAIRPKMILLDEPFSALDADLRYKLSSDVVALLRAQQTTAIIVTHDREEALVSSDQVILMRDGRIAQSGSPEEVYESPASPTVAVSTGDALVLNADRYADGSYNYPLSAQRSSSRLVESGLMVIRPEEIVIHKEDGSPGVSGTLVKIDYFGHDAMLFIELQEDSRLIKVRVLGSNEIELGDKVILEHLGPIRYFSGEEVII